MTTLPDRPRSAVVVIDMQTDVVAGAYARDAVIHNIAALVERTRRAGTDVIWVQHSDTALAYGSDGWQIVTELQRRSREPLIAKHYPDAFEETDLERILADRGVGRLIIAGASSDMCIRSTLHGAQVRGYDTVLVADAHTTGQLSVEGAPTPAQIVAHTNLYWQGQTAPGRTADAVSTSDLEIQPNRASG